MSMRINLKELAANAINQQQSSHRAFTQSVEDVKKKIEDLPALKEHQSKLESDIQELKFLMTKIHDSLHEQGEALEELKDAFQTFLEK